MTGRPGEIDVADIDILDGADEFARLWYRPDGKATCVIDPHGLDPDPFVFGLVMVDCIRHGAKAYAQAVGVSEAAALSRIWEGFDAERLNPTDAPSQVNPTRKTN
jgi:hypothetical protein